MMNWQAKFIGICIALTGMNATAGSGDSPEYAVSSIPETLRKGANAYVWQDRTVYEVVSSNRATVRVFMAITILNPSGKHHANIVLGYSKHIKITLLRGSIFDATGKEIRKIKQSEIYDQSASGDNLFSDNRLKAMDLSNGSYPYTIEYEYTTEFKSLFFAPSFTAYPGEKVSVGNAEFVLTYPRTYKPRYKTKNFASQPDVKIDGQTETMKWTFKDLAAVESEPFGPEVSEFTPSIVTSPSSFVFDDYPGDLSTWNSFGQWINLLNQGRDVLPEETRAKVKAIADEFDKPEEKVRALYYYLQGKTRYVSIQLGIGGYQPFEASVVDKVSYGDCKALSNYMISLLSAAGIKSNYVLVQAGPHAEPLDVGFPSSQFNHAVVCVPMGKDSIWLECTSQRNPFGYMGTHTGNRTALAITNNGAVPVKTPSYSENESIMSRTADVVVDQAGNGRAKILTRYRGVEYEDVDHLLGNNTDAQKKWIQENTSIPVFDVNSFSFKDHGGKIPAASVSLDLALNKLATVSGKRLFLTPNIMNRLKTIPAQVDVRKTQLELRFSFSHIDTVNFSLPESFYPEHLPQGANISSKFGSYENSFSVQEGKLVYIRKFVRKRGTFAPEDYKDFVEFYRSVNKADNQKIVFLNKT